MLSKETLGVEGWKESSVARVEVHAYAAAAASVCDLDIHPSETYTLVYLSQTSLYRFHDGGGWESLTRGTVSARSGQR